MGNAIAAAEVLHGVATPIDRDILEEWKEFDFENRFLPLRIRLYARFKEERVRNTSELIDEQCQYFGLTRAELAQGYKARTDTATTTTFVPK